MKWTKLARPQACDNCQREYNPFVGFVQAEHGGDYIDKVTGRRVKIIDWVCPHCGYDNTIRPPTPGCRDAIMREE